MTDTESTAAAIEAPEIKAARLFVLAADDIDRQRSSVAAMRAMSVTEEWVLATDGKRGIKIKRPEGVSPAPVVGFPGLLSVMADWEKAPIFAETTRDALTSRLSAVLEWRTDKADCDAEKCDHGKEPCVCAECDTTHERNCRTCGGTEKHPTKMQSFAIPEKVFVVAGPAGLEILRGGMKWQTPTSPPVPLSRQILIDAYFLTDALSALSILGVEAITLRSQGAGGALVIEWAAGAIVIVGISA